MQDKLYLISLQLLWMVPVVIGLVAIALSNTDNARQARHLRTLLMGGFAFMFCLYKISNASESRCDILDRWIDPLIGMQFFFFTGFVGLSFYLLVILVRPSALA